MLHRMLWVAWITKEEDQRLREISFASKRAYPLQAYEQAGIQLVADTAVLVGGEDLTAPD